MRIQNTRVVVPTERWTGLQVFFPSATSFLSMTTDEDVVASIGGENGVGPVQLQAGEQFTVNGVAGDGYIKLRATRRKALVTIGVVHGNDVSVVDLLAEIVRSRGK